MTAVSGQHDQHRQVRRIVTRSFGKRGVTIRHSLVVGLSNEILKN